MRLITEYRIGSRKVKKYQFYFALILKFFSLRLYQWYFKKLNWYEYIYPSGRAFNPYLKEDYETEGES